jgi:hypothetical protein
LKRKDTTYFKFVQWKSAKHTIKPAIKDSLVYFFVTDHDTIQVEYIYKKDSVTSAIQNLENGVLNIYPNAFSDKIHIEYKGSTLPVEISLMDMQGRQVQKIRATHLFEGDN